MSTKLSTYLTIFLLFFSFACKKEQSTITKQDLIEEAVEKKIIRLISNKQKRCQNELVQQANIIVDSILIAKAKASKDTIPKPPKPIKPDQPDAFLLEDSFAIQPLLKKTIAKDTLLDK